MQATTGGHGIGAEGGDEVLDRRARGERDDVGGRHRVALIVGDRGGDGAVGVDDLDLPAGGDEAIGQHVAGDGGSGQEHAAGAGRERLEQPLGDEPLGHEVGHDAPVGQGRRRPRPDGGDRCPHHAGVGQVGEEPLDAVG